MLSTTKKDQLYDACPLNHDTHHTRIAHEATHTHTPHTHTHTTHTPHTHTHTHTHTHDRSSRRCRQRCRWSRWTRC
jgi:hypothetical protein